MVSFPARLAISDNTCTHITQQTLLVKGHGVDRHLLGLRCQIKTEEEKKKAYLFTDPSYIQSMSFALSTSNMSPGDHLYGGFAPVVPNGYGINYALGKSKVKLSVSTWISDKETDGYRLKDSIDQTLVELPKKLGL